MTASTHNLVRNLSSCKNLQDSLQIKEKNNSRTILPEHQFPLLLMIFKVLTPTSLASFTYHVSHLRKWEEMEYTTAASTAVLNGAVGCAVSIRVRSFPSLVTSGKCSLYPATHELLFASCSSSSSLPQSLSHQFSAQNPRTVITVTHTDVTMIRCGVTPTTAAISFLFSLSG